MGTNEPPSLNVDSAYKVKENSPILTTAATVFGVDSDYAYHSNATLSYRIADGNAGNAFGIDNQGFIFVASETLDFEQYPLYTLSVCVKDSGQSLTTTQKLDDTNINLVGEAIVTSPLETCLDVSIDIIDVNDITNTGFGADEQTSSSMKHPTTGGSIVKIYGSNFGPVNGSDTTIVHAEYGNVINSDRAMQMYTKQQIVSFQI